jgi:hypothetical protein
LGGVFSTIEGNTIHDIAIRGWLDGWDLAGLKLLASNDTMVRNNHIYRCGGTGGIWLDWMAQGTRVTGNLLHDNSNDIYMEVNHGPYLLDNNLFLSDKSLRDRSQGGAYAHNLIAGAVMSRTVKDRRTPWFTPHTLEDMKLLNITHKDARFYNNLLTGKNRLADYGTSEKVQISGNVELDENSITLQERETGWWLTLPPAPGRGATTRPVVTTELLGKAHIPEQAFEHSDGTPYRIDRDYFGRKRTSEHPAPGPFRSEGGKRLEWKVWPKN